jgi:hypothetical protein
MLLSPSCAFGGMAVASGSAVNGAGVLGGRDGCCANFAEREKDVKRKCLRR